MSLGDHFPDEIKSGYAERALKNGTVLKLHLKDTNPPKPKRFIIVGQSADNKLLAIVLINSAVNRNVNLTNELMAHHLYFKREGREDFLEWDSYVDCAHLKELDAHEIEQKIKDKPEAKLGELCDEDWEKIRTTLRGASTIKGKIKKKFGFFDE